MRALLGSALAVALAAAAVCPASDKDTPIDPKKLVGRWEPREPQKGETVVLEFTKDGKMSYAAVTDGKSVKYEGSYKLNGNKLDFAMKSKDAEVKETVTVLKLTDTELATENAKGKKDTFRRARVDR